MTIVPAAGDLRRALPLPRYRIGAAMRSLAWGSLTESCGFSSSHTPWSGHVGRYSCGRIAVAAHAQQKRGKGADLTKPNNHKGNQEWALLGSNQ